MFPAIMHNAMAYDMQEERTYVTVEIKWDKECLREGDREVS
jgi:hypothetical protein